MGRHWSSDDGGAGDRALLDDDDPYIAELRRAIVDPSPLGPREDFEPEDAMADFYGGELEDSRWKGFRRRR